MARRGRFGRLPRVSPDLTSTIVAIAREAESKRDSVLMDAWQHGGMFEGQKATDELVLAHWRQRLANVAKDDPLHDDYANTITQYTYSIAESKASTEYAQGKRSDMSMAQFYLQWAKKVPKNSEFYRVLQRDAAQFIRAAKAKGKAAADKAKELAYQHAQESDYNHFNKAGEYITNVMRHLAASNALVGAEAGGSDLTNFDPSDPAAMLRILSTITLSPKGGPGVGDEAGNPEVLYHDPLTGKAVTGSDIVAQLRKIDPHFDGRVTLGYVRGLIQRQLEGTKRQLDRANKTGHATDVNNLQKQQQYVSEIGREASLWPTEQSYTNARSQWLQTWQNPTATPDEKMQAFRQYATTLTKLAGGKEVDDNTRSRLMAEVNGDGNVSSIAEDLYGFGKDGGGKDIGETHTDVARLIGMQQAVASGQMVWTTGATDSQGVFHPQQGGPEIGAATVADIKQVSPVNPIVVFIPQHGAGAIPVAVSGVNIMATAVDEKGVKVDMTDANSVGAAYDVTIAGLKTRVYSYKGADGHTYYSTSTPWNDQVVRSHDTPNGVVLDLSALVPRKTDGSWPDDVAAGNGAFGLSDPNRTTGEQTLVMDPTAAVYTSDPARGAAGPDPMTDFFSPTLAALTSTPEGMKQLAKLQDDPAFRQELQIEAEQAATNDQGVVDQGSLSKYMSEVSVATNLGQLGKTANDIIGFAQSLFGRSTTTSTFAVSPELASTRVATPAVGNATPQTFQPVLPSDTIRGTHFDALARAFQPGTNVLRAGSEGVSGGMQLTLGNQIKVPTPPAGNVTPQTFTPPPVTTQPIHTVVQPTPTTAVHTYLPTPNTPTTPQTPTGSRTGRPTPY